MKIAVIGAGLTGLTAAYELTKSGHQVTVFEKDQEPGGLAGGFKKNGWDWSLEKAYHHWFTNDDAVIGLAKELGLTDKLIIKRPVTANFWHGQTYPFDSPANLLRYPGLTGIDKLRTAFFVSFCKINPFWQPLENITSKKLAKAVGGDHAWKNLWEPLMIAKFGDYSDKVAASWLWARIKKRTPSLVYMEGGFRTLVTSLENAIKTNSGRIYINTNIDQIKTTFKNTSDKDSRFNVYYHVLEHDNTKKSNGRYRQFFDTVLLTIPSTGTVRLIPQLAAYHLPLLSIPHLHAQTLILETEKPILDKVYWLNILDRSFPFLAVVAHTNFMDSKHYGGHHLTYFGNYLPPDHPYLPMTKEQLFKVFDPFIKQLIHSSHLSLITSHLFTAPFAQPVHLLHYSQLAPKPETGIPGLYLANLDSIYPWDRGTNYAVELGIRVAVNK